MDRRGEFIELGTPVDGDPSLGHHLFVRHAAGDKLWDAGAFRVWSLSDLEAAAGSKLDGADDSQIECVFEIHIRDRDIRPVEVSSLQADSCKAENQELGGTMFQVASNFNCCENASYRRNVDCGNFVTNLMSDSTQGPAAASGAGKRFSFSNSAQQSDIVFVGRRTRRSFFSPALTAPPRAGVAAITRTHAAFFLPGTAPEEWGQTSSRQVSLPCPLAALIRPPYGSAETRRELRRERNPT